jgi:hypothetical protein
MDYCAPVSLKDSYNKTMSQFEEISSQYFNLEKEDAKLNTILKNSYYELEKLNSECNNEEDYGYEKRILLNEKITKTIIQIKETTEIRNKVILEKKLVREKQEETYKNVLVLTNALCAANK